MSLIVFKNPGEIDIRSITSFGVSVKEGENPIGFFGTGLKYAIAVLLRTGHEVVILSGTQVVRFGLIREDFRGQEVDYISMSVNGAAHVPLSFTTQLGKQWAVWMAYREIACNCKDEGGEAAQEAYMPDEEAGFTKIIVKGVEFSRAHDERGLLLLEDEPHFVIGTTEVRRRPNKALFYRGVRVHPFQLPTLFTYNSIGAHELTEDRTLKHQYEADSVMRRAIMRSDDSAFIRACVLADDDTAEGRLDFHGWSIDPSETFLRVVGECSVDRNSSLNTTALKVWQEKTKHSFEPHEIGMSKVQQRSMKRALDFCQKLGFPIRGAYPIKVCETLGEGILGRAHDQTIYIAERTFHLGGTKQLASTLIEEYVHLKFNYHDMTRELQSFLFDKLVSVGEELVGEPL